MQDDRIIAVALQHSGSTEWKLLVKVFRHPGKHCICRDTKHSTEKPEFCKESQDMGKAHLWGESFENLGMPHEAVFFLFF